MQAINIYNLRYLRVDNDPAYLEATYKMRYSVYCREKQFLKESDYPNKLEIDPYDKHAMHFAAINDEGLVKGTARLVCPPDGKFPMLDHCQLYQPLPEKTGEVSRMAISKKFRVDLGTDAFGTTQIFDDHDERKFLRRLRQGIALGLYKAIFQEGAKAGIKHCAVAMEPALAKLLERNFLVFEPIGPEVDYFGPVRPYLLSVKNLTSALKDKNPDMYHEFHAGL